MKGRALLFGALAVASFAFSSTFISGFGSAPAAFQRGDAFQGNVLAGIACALVLIGLGFAFLAWRSWRATSRSQVLAGAVLAVGLLAVFGLVMGLGL